METWTLFLRLASSYVFSSESFWLTFVLFYEQETSANTSANEKDGEHVYEYSTSNININDEIKWRNVHINLRYQMFVNDFKSFLIISGQFNSFPQLIWHMSPFYSLHVQIKHSCITIKWGIIVTESLPNNECRAN